MTLRKSFNVSAYKPVYTALLSMYTAGTKRTAGDMVLLRGDRGMAPRLGGGRRVDNKPTSPDGWTR